MKELDLRTYLDDDDISGNEITSLDLLFSTISDHSSSESDIGLELGDNVSGLLFLVPTDEGVLS